ncbi:MAG: ABC transporter permease [Eubacteriales bacterium]
MRLGFKIAVRFLFSSKGQTILIILGIAIGVSVQIFIGSLIQGLQKGLIDKTIGSSSHITITDKSEDGEIEDYESKAEIIQSADENIKYVSSANDRAALVKYGDSSQTLLLRGLDYPKADKIYKFSDNLVEGTYPKDKREILLGVDLRDDYGIKLGDEIVVSAFGIEGTACKVVGFFDLKVSALNKGWGIITLEASHEIFGSNKTATSIEIQVNEDSIFETGEIADKISAALDDGDLNIEDWQSQNGQLLSGLQGQSISSIMIQVFVLVSVVLGIASVLAITVLQKSKQIGILKAMGIRNSGTGAIFLFEGLILGVMGAIAGILFGLGLSWAFTKFALNPDGTPVVELYVSYSFYALSGLIAIASSVLASLIPALRSSKLNPIDIIRNN